RECNLRRSRVSGLRDSRFHSVTIHVSDIYKLCVQAESPVSGTPALHSGGSISSWDEGFSSY
ncbi:MAG TPA: hypothetical protein VE467_06945, partial [Chryseolinea sp.]|nr:hypothetical protein [Chryseolinea sp.]